MLRFVDIIPYQTYIDDDIEKRIIFIYQPVCSVE
jgi:hypothetical protein